MLRRTTTPIIEFPSLFIDHAQSLLREANHHLEAIAYDDAIIKNPELWLQYTTNMSLISMRLNSVIIWAESQQKATSETSCAQCISSLKGRTIGIKNEPEKARHLPAHLQYLLKASHALFMQAANIEDQTNALNASQPALTLIK